MESVVLELIRRDMENLGITQYNLSVVMLEIDQLKADPTVAVFDLPKGFYYVAGDTLCMLKCFAREVLEFVLESDNGTVFYEKSSNTAVSFYLTKMVGNIAHNENITVTIEPNPNLIEPKCKLTIPMIKVEF